MDSIKYFKNFTIYHCRISGDPILKLETYVNGSVSSFTILINKVDENRINKLLENYNNDIKEIKENGK